MPAPPLPEPDPEPELPPPPEVAPLGETPPPVGPDAPLEPDPLVPLEAVPPPPPLPLPLPLPLPPLDAALDEPPEPTAAEEDPEEEPPVDEEVVVVVVEVVEAVEAGGEAAIVAVGTVSAGAPVVSVAAEPPPHAARPAHAANPATRAAVRLSAPFPNPLRRQVTAVTSDVERLHAPSAVRAVIQVLLAELVAPVAEAEVLDRPGQLRWGRRERQQLRHHLERLARVPIDVHPPRLGLQHDLPPGGWRPHPVPLTRPHPQPSYSRGRIPVARGWRGGCAAAGAGGCGGGRRRVRSRGAVAGGAEARWRAGEPPCRLLG